MRRRSSRRRPLSEISPQQMEPSSAETEYLLPEIILVVMKELELRG